MPKKWTSIKIIFIILVIIGNLSSAHELIFIYLFFFFENWLSLEKSKSNLKPDGGKIFNLSRPKARHLNWSKPCLLQIRTLVGWNLHWRTLKSYWQGSGPQEKTSRFGHPNRTEGMNWYLLFTVGRYVKYNIKGWLMILTFFLDNCQNIIDRHATGSFLLQNSITIFL